MIPAPAKPMIKTLAASASGEASPASRPTPPRFAPAALARRTAPSRTSPATSAAAPATSAPASRPGQAVSPLLGERGGEGESAGGGEQRGHRQAGRLAAAGQGRERDHRQDHDQEPGRGDEPVVGPVGVEAGFEAPHRGDEERDEGTADADGEREAESLADGEHEVHPRAG